MELSHLAAPAGLLGRLIPCDICHCRGPGQGSAVPQPGRWQGQQLVLGFWEDAGVRCGIRDSCSSAETRSAEPSTELLCLVSGKASTLCSDTVTSLGDRKEGSGCCQLAHSLPGGTVAASVPLTLHCRSWEG